ncbi:MAG: ATP-binding cassette domain-containing protein [Frankiales bacterium]|nr:MAG: ATP-binding cassette domain-containing protein [Frankiales bacterium]
MTLLDRAAPPTPPTPRDRPARRADLSRLRGRATGWALAAAAVAAVAQTAGTVAAGRLAESPTVTLVWLLALAVVGGALLDTGARMVWWSVVDRAEGRLRGDLLEAALQQPLSVLSEQPVGEVLDRVDDDTHELGNLLRRIGWDLVRTLLRAGPMWVVAGVTWWPAWVLFPLVGVGTFLVVRPLTAEVAARKLAEEIAWTEQAAAMEEGIAARDDVRSSLGQAYVIRRCAELSAEVHRRVGATTETSSRIARRAGLLLHGLLALTAVSGVLLVLAGSLTTAELVTLFLVTTMFVGNLDQISRHMPELQAGLGALTRVRMLLRAAPEPAGGAPLPEGPLDLAFRDLDFAYDDGAFALSDVSLHLPAGRTLALVGRTGSGKSTLASLVSRAVEPPPGAVLIGGIDVRELDLQSLRRSVGVVTQRTDVLAASLLENITLLADVPRTEVEEAVADLGLEDWVRGLPQGLDTLLGPGGTTLSAGEEQLVAFARLLVRDVRLVVLDEATARMDPVTEGRVVRASERLLTGRTGIVIAHRLSTTTRADVVAVMSGGRVVQTGPRTALAEEPGPFRELLAAAGDDLRVDPADGARDVGSARRVCVARDAQHVGDGPRLARHTWSMLRMHPRWGLLGGLLFLLGSLVGSFGAATGFVWGLVVEELQDGGRPVAATALLAVSLLAAPVLLAWAFRIYPQWWIAVLLRVRLAVLRGQTMQHRLPRTPPGEVVGRALDADRFARYADRWVDLVNGLAVALMAAVAAQSVLAGLVLLAVMVLSAIASLAGSPAAGRSAAAASTARARFGRSLVSALESARTVKLAAATPYVHRHLRAVDGGRVDAAVREHRVQAVLDGLPIVLVQCGVVVGWWVFLVGGWDLSTALLVTTAVSGFDWFGRVAGAVITEAPSTRAWAAAASRYAGGVDLTALPPGVDLVDGSAPQPDAPPYERLDVLDLTGFGAVHDDGTLGVEDVDLTVRRGELVLLLGRIGSGKSSLLAALAGLVDHTGSLRWNGREVGDPQVFLRPGQVAYVAQVPRVLSGSFAGNLRLDHAREPDRAVADARLADDIGDAGGIEAIVGHRGVRLSGGQVQRLALARALATEAELVLADDVSSALDARTELELWEALRARGTTVLGSSSKRAALRAADRVVVLDGGRAVATGPWSELAPEWGHLAA